MYDVRYVLNDLPMPKKTMVANIEWILHFERVMRSQNREVVVDYDKRSRVVHVSSCYVENVIDGFKWFTSITNVDEIDKARERIVVVR